MHHRPFSDGSNAWKWPEETRPDRKRFAFTFEEDTFVLRVPEPLVHSPDLRALTVFEALELGKLRDGERPERIRLELGSKWPEREAYRLAARASFLGARLRIPTTILWTRGPGTTPVALAPDDPLDGQCFRRGAVQTVRASEKVDFEDLARAVDRWLELARAAVAHHGAGATPTIVPIVVLKSPADRIHPRIHWIARKLREAGIFIETPDPEDVPTTRFVSRLLDTCLEFRRALPVKGFGSWHGVEYEHILPRSDRKLALWKPLQEALESGRLMPVMMIHEGIGNLKSSQAFAVNLFAGLDAAGLLGESVARAFGTGPLEDVSLEFEFWDDDFKRFIGESDHQTQVDVLVRAMDGSTLRVFLIEVKLTEPYFGRCRGPYVEENEGTAVCGVATATERSASCYLRAHKSRRYLDLAELAFPRITAELGADGACPLRLDGYQLARNLVIRSWLAGDLHVPGVPPVPERFRPRGATATDVRFAVVSASETPALASEPLSALGKTARDRLAKLGIEWVDARALLDAVRRDPRAQEFSEYLEKRYQPVFA